MGSIKILQMDREGVEDRVYRLHYNSSQKRTDTFSAVRRGGGVTGGGRVAPQGLAVGVDSSNDARCQRGTSHCAVQRASGIRRLQVARQLQLVVCASSCGRL